MTPDGNVRMIAHGEALQVRMEIYPAGGELVADTGLREGNVFTNQEQEQMRITPEGRVGIGTKTPETTLDVAGTIKTTGGIQFEDGSVLNTAKGLPTKEAPGGAGGRRYDDQPARPEHVLWSNHRLRRFQSVWSIMIWNDD